MSKKKLTAATIVEIEREPTGEYNREADDALLIFDRAAISIVKAYGRKSFFLDDLADEPRLLFVVPPFDCPLQQGEAAAEIKEAFEHIGNAYGPDVRQELGSLTLTPFKTDAAEKPKSLGL